MDDRDDPLLSLYEAALYADVGADELGEFLSTPHCGCGNYILRPVYSKDQRLIRYYCDCCGQSMKASL